MEEVFSQLSGHEGLGYGWWKHGKWPTFKLMRISVDPRNTLNSAACLMQNYLRVKPGCNWSFEQTWIGLVILSGLGIGPSAFDLSRILQGILS